MMNGMRIADEYMEVVYKLWEASWEDDAVVVDKEKGIYTDPQKSMILIMKGNTIKYRGIIYVSHHHNGHRSFSKQERQLVAVSLRLNMQN